MIKPRNTGTFPLFVERSKAILKDNLVGVYLHGSAAMGCFNPEKSDIDLIIAVAEPMPDPVKREYMKMVVELDAAGPAKGIEMSAVTKSVCAPFVYPTPFELHYSRGHLDRYRSDPEAYIQTMQGTDKDLAAHFTIIKARGRCLWGAPIKEVFADVPAADYLDSIVYDIAGAVDEIAANTMYFTLNLARVMAYKQEGLILSKKEGGDWALRNVPEEYKGLVEAALKEYTEGVEVEYEPEMAREYARMMVGKIGI